MAQPALALRRGVRTGAVALVIGGAVVVPYRLHEQVTRTRNPALIGIFKSHVADPCSVLPAGREGDVSIWLVECGSAYGPIVGWDERAHLLLRDEKLFERVPRLRSVPPYGTTNPFAPKAP
jgi:hypothetical protein